MKKYLSLIAIALLLGACTKDLDIDFEQQAPKVVVMSCVEPDSVLSLRLSFSRFFLSSQPFRTIDNAVVTLLVNGSTEATATPSANGRYVFDYRPRVGDHLALQVQVPDYGTVTSATTVPSPASVNNMQATLTANEDNDRTYSVRFTLNDPAGEDNFYAVRVIERECYEWDGVRHCEDSYRYFTCNDYMLTGAGNVGSILDGDNPGEVFDKVLYFTDDYFNGQSHVVEIAPELHYRNTEALLEITSYSRDRYLYELTTSMDGDSFEDLFGEPVQVHTNIDGGIGIFGARNRILVPIPVSQ